MKKRKFRKLALGLSATLLLSSSFDANAVILQSSNQQLVQNETQQNLAQNKKIIKMPEYAPDRVIVKFKKGVSVKVIKNILNQIKVSSNSNRIAIIKEYKSKELSRIKVLKVDKGKVKDIIRLLKKEYGKYIEYAEPDYKVKVLAMPNDPYYNYQWEWPVIQAEEAWNMTTGDSNVVVVDIDTGIDYNHEDLKDNVWVNQGEITGQDTNNNGIDDGCEDGVDNDNNGYIDDCHGWNALNDNGDPLDDNGHGTHTAGTIGAVTNNNVGVAGANWNVKVAACKFLDAYGSGSTSDAVECFDYANNLKAHNVNVVATSNSWGGGGYSQVLYDAIKSSMDNGILTVCAAGNASSDNEAYPHYPSSYDLPNIISVAASDHSTNSDNLAGFSNYGKFSVDLAAPGEDILSTLPNNQYASWSGTSMATPHVTGEVALLYSYFNSDTWYQIRNKIFLGVDQFPGFENKVFTNGRLNMLKPFNLTDSDTMLKFLDSSISYWQIFNPSQNTMPIKVFSINKNGSASWVRVTGDNQSVELYDDGQNGDRFANDGYFEGNISFPAKPIFYGTIEDSFGNSISGYSGVYNLGTGYMSDYNYTTMNSSSLQNQNGSKETIKAIEKLPISNYDDNAMVINLPFTVHLYGYPVNSIAISTNGVITPYADNLPAYTYYPLFHLPIPELNNFDSPVIAPMGADLNPSACTSNDCGIYMITMGNEVIFEWRNVPFFDQSNPSNGVTFRVVFDKNDESIRFEYPDVTVGDSIYDKGASASIGIQFNKNHSLQYSYHQPNLSDGEIITFSPQIPQLFGDVPIDHPNRHAIYRLYLDGYTAGYNDNGTLNYHPDEILNRAQLVVFLVKMKDGVEGEFDYSQNPYFNDVQPGDWMFKWVQEAYELGLTSGCGNGNFCPYSPVTKAQIAVFMVRQALGDDNFSYNQTPYFNDVDPNHWAFKWVQKAYELGLAEPCDDQGNFCPDQEVNRAYMADKIIKVLEEK